MAPYKVFLHADLLEQIPSKGKQRQGIMAFIHQLPADPHISSDYTTRDGSQRTLQIKIVGDYAITFWWMIRRFP